MDKFIEGKEYTTRSVCDHNCIFKMKVISRTEKTMKVLVDGEEKRTKIHVVEGREIAFPMGRYSMAPCFVAK